MSLAARDRHDDPIEGLMDKLHEREIAMASCRDALVSMQTDYEHNLRILREREADLQTLRAQFSMLSQQNATLEARCTAQLQRIKENDGEVKRQTQALSTKNETLLAQITILTQEKQSALRSQSDAEVELTQLRHDMHQLNAKIMKQVEMARNEARMDCETLIKEKDRVLRVREEQVHQDCVRLETRLLEMSSENARIRETTQNFELKLEDCNKIISRKDVQIEQLQAQLVELKRHATNMQSQLQQEQEFHRLAKEQLDRSAQAVGSTAQRDLERRTHDLELAEQKISAMKSQHESDIRRRAEEKDDIVRTYEDKLRGMNERIRTAESREAEARDDCERQRKRSAEIKKELSATETNSLLLHDRAEDLERVISKKELENGRLHGEIQRLLGQLQEKEKEAEALRVEFERREWQDRLVADERMQGRVKEWRSMSQQQTSQRFASQSVPPNNNNNTQVDSSDLENFGAAGGGRSRSAARAFPDVSTVLQSATPMGMNRQAIASDILQEIKAQLVNQSHTGAYLSDGINKSGASLLMGPGGYHDRSIQQELTLLREKHELDRLEMERKLGEATRLADRQRRRAERLIEEQKQDNEAQEAIREANRHLNVSSDRMMMSSTAPPSVSSATNLHSFSGNSPTTRLPPPIAPVRSSSPTMMNTLQQQFASPLVVKSTPAPFDAQQQSQQGASSAPRPWRP